MQDMPDQIEYCGCEAGFAPVSSKTLNGLDERRLHQVRQIRRRTDQTCHDPFDVVHVQPKEAFQAFWIARAAARSQLPVVGGQGRNQPFSGIFQRT